MRELSKEQLLKEVPEMFYNLKFKYNFYFNGFATHISRDILEIVEAKKERNKHKALIYVRNNRVFIVVYKKHSPDIYYCNEYKNDNDDHRIQYFVRKVRRAYQKAEEDYAETLYTNQMVDSRRV